MLRKCWNVEEDCSNVAACMPSPAIHVQCAATTFPLDLLTTHGSRNFSRKNCEWFT